MLLLLLACGPAAKDDDTGGDDTAGETADTGETGETAAAVEDCATPEDDDGDGSTDAVDARNCTPFYADADGDGHGVETDAECRCAPTDSHPTALAGDCDDADAAVFPGAPEWCDGLDTNCADDTDAGLVTWYPPDASPQDVTAAWAAGTPEAPAAVELGDGTFAVCSGTYYVHAAGEVAHVTIQGVGGDVVLDGGDSGTIVAVSAEESVGLDGLTLQHGLGMTGGGFEIMAASVAIRGCVLQENESRGSGGGGFVWYAETTVEETSFVDNRGGGDGGGLFVFLATLVATDVSFTGNEVDDENESGGGALAWRGEGNSSATLEGVTASNNRVTTGRDTAKGGAMWFQNDGSGVVSIARATFTDNVATGESAAAAGGALAIYGNAAGAALTDVTFEGNVATTTQVAMGGAAWVSIGGEGESLAIDGLTAIDNRATGNDASRGGALAIEAHAGSGATVRLARLRLDDNHVTSDVDGGTTGSGGGVALDAGWSGLAISLTDAELADGAAATGGGAEVRVGAGSTLTVDGLVAEGNVGDGLRVVAAGSGGRVDIRTSRLADNSGAGLAVEAGDGTDLGVSLLGDAAAQNGLGGNTTGLRLECASSGGACEADSAFTTFAPDGDPNARCDVELDGACVDAPTGNETFRCWSDSGGAGCE